MRLILQKVSSARVEVDRELVGQIGFGLLVLVAIEKGDGRDQVARAARKLVELRIFHDADGKMNLDAGQADAAFLVVSQFTLAASLERGRRPSFERAAAPAVASELIAELMSLLREAGFEVAGGRFGALMDVTLTNSGPVTFNLEVG